MELLVTTSTGLESLLADEISQLCGIDTPSFKPGQVSVDVELAQAYSICLWSRLANRVLLKLADRDIKEAKDVYTLASVIRWNLHFTVDNTFVVDFIGTNRIIKNSQFGALTIKDAIADQFSASEGKRPSVDKNSPDIRIQGRLKRSHLTLYLDLSGQSLHKRGYRLKTGEAPVKEHIACAMLMRSGWHQHQSLPLFDPMCGAGTIAIEAALMAANVAPGLQHTEWGFRHWLQHDSASWDRLVDSAQAARTTPDAQILASDLDPKVLDIARQNAQNAGVAELIAFSVADATKHTIQVRQPGYLVSNPPYGERLGELTNLLPVFKAWGSHLKQHFADWHVSLLTTNRDLLRQLKLFADKEYKLYNGKLECQLVNYVINAENQQEKAPQVSGDFANRLKKNLRQTQKWLKSQSTNAYRIYDADLPEFNVAIDHYDDWLVVQEYAAPKTIPEHKVRQRLHEVLITLPTVTGVSADNIVLKTREQQKGKTQYQKLSDKRDTLVVHENGARFHVNLHDYLDTGLFLDHRETRQMVRTWAKDKHVLNLFAYTGSVSVHAALGGARSVTTVDMSKTYLDWARDNFALNQLTGAYEFVQADCTQWLHNHQRKYDLIFIDPPSFSNSKRMDATWDVQRDHVALLKDAIACLNPGGMLVFSNNLRKFKLDQSAFEGLAVNIENISHKTLPEDFRRNPKIHQCWVFQLVG